MKAPGSGSQDRDVKMVPSRFALKNDGFQVYRPPASKKSYMYIIYFSVLNNMLKQSNRVVKKHVIRSIT